MSKISKLRAAKKGRLQGPIKGKVAKAPGKPNGASDKKMNGVKKSKVKLNGHDKQSKKKENLSTNPDDSVEIKKRPSKIELKSVIEALKKEASLLMVRKALKYVPFYLKSEGLNKKLLKEIIRLWSEASEKIRVVCLLCLIRIYSKLNDKEKKQMVIKNLYTTFLSKCGITKFETMSMISFMRHSLIELYKIDSKIAFKQAQTSAQQLAITLKNATTHKNEESYKSVLNWRFANCLILLSQLITSLGEDGPIKSLTQQVIQLNIGAINLLTSPRYYPYYCHLIENLIHLSISEKVFIPVLPLMLSILKRLSFPLEKKIKKKPVVVKKAPKSKRNKKERDDDDDYDDDEDDDDDDDDDYDDNSDGHEDEDESDFDDDEDELDKVDEREKEGAEDEEEKPKKEYNIDLLNHVSLDEAQLPEYQEAVVNKLYELLSLYLASQCNRIAFPELIFLPSVHIKKWLKTNPGKPAQKFKVLLDKIKTDCDKIEDARKSVEFAFTNYNAVDAWEKKMRDSNKLTLPKLYESIKQQEQQ